MTLYCTHLMFGILLAYFIITKVAYSIFQRDCIVFQLFFVFAGVAITTVRSSAQMLQPLHFDSVWLHSVWPFIVIFNFSSVTIRSKNVLQSSMFFLPQGHLARMWKAHHLCFGRSSNVRSVPWLAHWKVYCSRRKQGESSSQWGHNKETCLKRSGVKEQ